VCQKNQKQSLVLNDGDLLCSVPLNIFALKLTLKTAKELVSLHDMYMPSKILLKDVQTLLNDHKCETCEDLLAVFRPYKVVSNVEHQQTWYQKNKEKCAEYNKHPQYLMEWAIALHGMYESTLVFLIEELVHSGCCEMQHLRHNSIFTFARIKILLWKINK